MTNYNQHFIENKGPATSHPAKERGHLGGRCNERHGSGPCSVKRVPQGCGNVYTGTAVLLTSSCTSIHTVDFLVMGSGVSEQRYWYDFFSAYTTLHYTASWAGSCKNQLSGALRHIYFLKWHWLYQPHAYMPLHSMYNMYSMYSMYCMCTLYV